MSKTIYSVTKGFLCTAWPRLVVKQNFVRQKDRNNTVIIRVHLSPIEALQLQIVDKRKHRNSCFELSYSTDKGSVLLWQRGGNLLQTGESLGISSLVSVVGGELSCVPWSSEHAAVFTGGKVKTEFAVRRRDCLTLGWRRLRRGSPSRSCVLCGRRCCSSLVPRWWRKPCRRLSAGRLSGFLRCCQTGFDTGSNASSEPLEPNKRNHI